MNSGGISLLLCLDKRRKKIKIKDGSYATFLEHLGNDATLKDFVGPNVTYQIFDTYFAMDVEIDEDTILEHLNVIKVVMTRKRPIDDATCSLISSDKKLKGNEMEDNNGTEMEDNNGTEVEGNGGIEMEIPEQNLVIVNPEEDANEPKMINWVVQNLKETIGTGSGSRTKFELDYTLPDFPENIKDKDYYLALTEKNAIAMNKEILSIIFSDCIKRFGLYPYHIYIAQKLIREYPHLKQRPGEGYEKWYQQLRSKFKNFRMKLDSIEIVQEYKKKFGRKSDKKADTSNIPDIVVRIEETIESLEDKRSIDDLKGLMHSEMKKREPDLVLINNKMDKTFADRTKLIRSEDIEKVKMEYPALFNVRQVLTEFSRLTKIDILKKMKESMVLYEEKMWDLTKKDLFGLKADVMRKMKNDNGGKEILTILLLPNLLKENVQRMFCKPCEIETNSKGPIIVYTGSSIVCSKEYEIYVDGHKIALADDVESAIGAIFASFWIFNIVYNHTLQKTLAFIEVCLLGLNYTKLSKVVSNLETKCKKVLDLE